MLGKKLGLAKWGILCLLTTGLIPGLADTISCPSLQLVATLPNLFACSGTSRRCDHRAVT